MSNVALSAKFNKFFIFEFSSVVGSKAYQLRIVLVLYLSEPIGKDREHSIFTFDAAVGLNVPGLLVITAGLIVPGLALASLICRWSGRTSSSIVQSMGQTLYYICLICLVFCK